MFVKRQKRTIKQTNKKLCKKMNTTPSLWWPGCCPCVSVLRCAAPPLCGTLGPWAVCVCRRRWWCHMAAGSRRWRARRCRSGRLSRDWTRPSRYSRLCHRVQDHTAPSGRGGSMRTRVHKPMHMLLTHDRAHKWTYYLQINTNINNVILLKDKRHLWMIHWIVHSIDL